MTQGARGGGTGGKGRTRPHTSLHFRKPDRQEGKGLAAPGLERVGIRPTTKFELDL